MIVAADMSPILNLWAFGQDSRICWVYLSMSRSDHAPAVIRIFLRPEIKPLSSRDAQTQDPVFFKVEYFSET